MSYEDTTQGEVDLGASGDPDPVRARTPADIAGDVNQRVNQKRTGPSRQGPKSKQSGGNPLSGIGDAAKGLAGDVGGAFGKAGQAIDSSGLAQMPGLTDLNPVDWANFYKQDAAATWGLARQAYRTLGGGYHDGVSNLFAGHSGTSKLLQSGANSAVETAVPILGLKESGQELLTEAGAVKSGESQQQEQQQLGQEQEQAVQDAPGAAADVATLFTPGGLAGKAAMVAVPAAEQLLGAKGQNDTDAALAWAAVGTLLTFGHIPGPVKDLLKSRLPGMSDVMGQVAEAVGRKTQAGRNAMDPEKATQQTKDWIAKQLESAGVPEFRKVEAKAAEAGKRQVPAEIGPHGEIKLLTSEADKRRKQVLDKLGVSDLAELEEKVAREGQLSGKAAKLVRDNWKQLGLPYNLERFAPGEAALRDPRAALNELKDSPIADKVQGHLSAVNHYLAEIHSGLFTGSKDPATAILRALAGHARVLDLAHGEYMRSMVDALGEWGVNEANGKALMKAAEGDQEAYKALPAEARAVADGWALIRSGMREQSRGTNYAKNFIANWVPRLDVRAEKQAVGRPSTASVLAREARKHREVALQMGPEAKLILGQRFKTVQDANAALEDARRALAGHLTDLEKPLRADMQGNPEAEEVRRLAASDPVQATERAQQLARDHYAPKDENFFRAVGRAAGYQAKSVGTAKALRELEQTIIRSKHPTTGGNVLRNAAVAIKDQRHAEEMGRQGYVHIDDPRFAGHMFDGSFAKDLNRYVDHASGGLRNVNVFNKAMQLERQLVSWIMFSPAIHGMNMAGRFGASTLMNPLETLGYLQRGKAVPWLAHQADDEAYALRREAWASGVLPMKKGKGWADQLHGVMGDALGDIDNVPPEAAQEATKAGRMRSLMSTAKRPFDAANDWFWSGVHDYGVMMYHLEKEAALRHGVDEANARLYAARRANSWMGMVAPEDTNPMLHDLSRLVAFAPNWWRTYAELLVPTLTYRRSGIALDRKMAQHVAYQGAKTTAAMFAFQKLTGNGLNLMLSGHLQNENQPGQQDRIEATAPWLDHLPGFSGTPAVDPKTGARRTMENPLARQQYDLEQAMGLQSGYRDYQPTDTMDGMTKFAVSRLSPIFNSAFSLFNVDLYHTATQGQLRSVLEGQKPGQPSPGSALATIMQAVPGVSTLQQNIERNVQQNGKDTTSILGTKYPTSFSDYVKDAQDAGSRFLLSGLLGINAPYPYAEKTRGQAISDQDYTRVQQLQTQYQSQMQQMDAEALSGQMTPDQWLQQYKTLSQTHSGEMNALFKGAPNYVNGSEGMLNDWEGLYDKATNPDGTIDQAKLAQLQAQFNSEHTPDQMSQMNALLKQNDTKYPMLALYHKTLDQYNTWQEQWASQHGVDITTLRQDIKDYNQLYGDARAQNEFKAKHPEIRSYETAKSTQWDRSLAGITYLSFYGQSAKIVNYLRAHRLTEQQLLDEQAQQAAQQ